MMGRLGLGVLGWLGVLVLVVAAWGCQGKEPAAAKPELAAPAAAAAAAPPPSCPPCPGAEEEGVEQGGAEQGEEADSPRPLAGAGQGKGEAVVRTPVVCADVDTVVEAWLLRDVANVSVDGRAGMITFDHNNGTFTLSLAEAFPILPGDEFPADGPCATCTKLLVVPDPWDYQTQAPVGQQNVIVDLLYESYVHAVEVEEVNGDNIATKVKLLGFENEPTLNLTADVDSSCVVWFKHDPDMLDLHNVEVRDSGYVAIARGAEGLVEPLGDWNLEMWESGGKYPVALDGVDPALPIRLHFAHVPQNFFKRNPKWTAYHRTTKASLPRLPKPLPRDLKVPNECASQPCGFRHKSLGIGRYYLPGGSRGPQSWRNNVHLDPAARQVRAEMTGSGLVGSFSKNTACSMLTEMSNSASKTDKATILAMKFDIGCKNGQTGGSKASNLPTSWPLVLIGRSGDSIARSVASEFGIHFKLQRSLDSLEPVVMSALTYGLASTHVAFVGHASQSGRIEIVKSATTGEEAEIVYPTVAWDRATDPRPPYGSTATDVCGLLRGMNLTHVTFLGCAIGKATTLPTGKACLGGDAMLWASTNRVSPKRLTVGNDLVAYKDITLKSQVQMNRDGTAADWKVVGNHVVAEGAMEALGLALSTLHPMATNTKHWTATSIKGVDLLRKCLQATGSVNWREKEPSKSRHVLQFELYLGGQECKGDLVAWIRGESDGYVKARPIPSASPAKEGPAPGK